MTISVRIEKDSIGPNGARITTFVLRYHRYVHSEFMTHRMFSRNASSSRAQPSKKLRAQVLENMAMPIEFGLNAKGMQSHELASRPKKLLAKGIIKVLSYVAVFGSYLLDKLGLHKQIVNRYIEPFSYITVIVTATEWANFFALRCHKDAQPEIQELAHRMWAAHRDSTPQVLKEGQWHLPFVHSSHELFIKDSVACCARVSYLNHDGTKPTHQQNLDLYNRLLGGSPIHASPAEHQAKASQYMFSSGNLIGFTQYRKTLENENITEFKGN